MSQRVQRSRPQSHLVRYISPWAFLALLAAPAAAANFEVAVGGSGLSFTPDSLEIQVGDTVTWRNAGGFHDVRADDGSFGNSSSSSAWTFSHTFTAAGTVGYHCSIHGGPGSGMFGTIRVTGATPTPQHGEIRFSQPTYSTSEGSGTATIAVQRIDGSDGAVAVGWSAAAGTATAGQDFTAATGTLSWADGDAAAKTFKVTIANDAAVEPNETVLLALSAPTGGAALDDSRKTATLTILDNDGTAGGPVAGPTRLTATAASTAEIALAWTDNANNETGYLVERRTPAGSFQQIASLPPNTTSFTATGLEAAKPYVFRVRASGTGVSFSPYSNEASAATNAVPGPCTAGPTTLCLNNGRFRAELDWRTPDGNTGEGQAVPLPTAPDSGLFYFFAPTNIEMLIKVLNACVAPFNHYWVFYAATTNVEFTLTVTDTQTGKVDVYFNPLNQVAPPVQDIDAFATCP